MTISFLSGAYKNAGDFLIEKRALSIIQRETDAKINKYLRTDLAEKSEQINNADAIVIGGGPLYSHNLEGTLPLDICINKLTAPIMIMGCGWYGAFGSNSLASNYSFTPQTLAFLKKVDVSGLGLSCRDLYTVNALKANGLNNVFMTGCPAWYDLNKLETTELNSAISPIPKIITVSDPALPLNYNSAIKVTKHLVLKYPSSQIIYLFHRGLMLDNQQFKKYYDEICSIPNVEVINIENDSTGFEVYDNCDLHIGFRVHAHIYNLSIRNKSILIEEDGRGAGVNEALGLVSIKSYNDQLMFEPVMKWTRRLMNHLPSMLKYSTNSFLCSEIDTYIDILNGTSNQILNNAFHMQKAYYECMKSFVNRLNYL